jgi:hypothetical protein
MPSHPKIESKKYRQNFGMILQALSTVSSKTADL